MDETKKLLERNLYDPRLTTEQKEIIKHALQYINEKKSFYKTEWADFVEKIHNKTERWNEVLMISTFSFDKENLYRLVLERKYGHFSDFIFDIIFSLEEHVLYYHSYIEKNVSVGPLSSFDEIEECIEKTFVSFEFKSMTPEIQKIS